MTDPTTGQLDKQRTNRRLESIALPLFLMMLAALVLVPPTTVPQGVWAAIAGGALLGLNLARHHYGIKTSLGTTILGLILFVSGIAALAGVYLPMFEILFIAAVANLLFYTLTGRGGKGDSHW